MHCPRVANNWAVKELGRNKAGEEKAEVRGIKDNEEAKERDINVKEVCWFDGLKVAKDKVWISTINWDSHRNDQLKQ